MQTYAPAAYAYRPRRLLVGGLLVELSPQDFEQLARQLPEETPVLTGTVGWLSKKRVYFCVRGGLTLYCKLDPDRRLALSTWEVERIDTGGGTIRL